MDNFAVNFTSGLSFVISLVALYLAWRANKQTKEAFTIVNNKKSRTVIVDTNDSKVTVIKEQVE